MTSTQARSSSVISGLSRARKGVGLGGRGEGTPRPPRRFSYRSVTLAALILPSVVLVALIYGYPAVEALIQSLHNGNLVDTGMFVGFQNYSIDFHNSVFWQAAIFTVIYCIVGVFGSWIVGLGLALLLRQKIHTPGLFKTLLLLPWIVPVVVTATAWKWLVASPTSWVPAHRREHRARSAAVPGQPGAGQDHRHRLQGLAQLPVHDADGQCRAGRRPE